MQMRQSTPSSFPSNSKARRQVGAAARLGLWAIVWAGALPGLGWPLPEDADQPIHIRAQTAEFGRDSRQALYLGSVQVLQGSLEVRADQLIVDHDGGRVLRIIAQGQPARYRQLLRQGELEADAATIVYHAGEQRIDLEGSARLIQSGSEVAGERIRYDLAAGKVAAGADQAPVRATLQPPASER